MEMRRETATVHKAFCLCCGGCGPMAASEVNARILAVLTGWNDEDSLCKACVELFQGDGKTPKRPVKKAH